MKEQALHKAIYDIENNHKPYSMRLWVDKYHDYYFRMIPILLLLAILISPKEVYLILFYFLNILYFSSQIFKFITVCLGITNRTKENYPIPDDLPIYSILLPLYNENKILNKLIIAMTNLDYPKENLDIKLLIEEDDLCTLSALDNLTLPYFIEIIKIPSCDPRTKPKACNYGLEFVRGKYVTIYDAEDIPDPMQLKKAVAKFNNSPPDLICLQARLNYYNKYENYISKLFSIEYSILFDYVIKGLQTLKMPLPLGGTSNHFIVEKLKEVGSWDAFNVTEDADLGLRLCHYGYKSAVFDSITLEESPISLKSWVIQRSRWIKGQILTALLHLNLQNKLTVREIIGILFSIYIPNLIYILLPFYILLCFLTNSYDHIIMNVNLLLGFFLPALYSIIIIIKNKHKNMKSSILLSVVYYWFLPVAGLRALWQICIKPFYWDKTEHGVSKLCT
jgi:glycosyltransferase XagB